MLTVLLIVLMVACYTAQSLLAKLFAGQYRGESSTASLVFATIFGALIALATAVTAGFALSPSLTTVLFGCANAVILVLFHLSQIGAAVRGSYAILNLCMLFGGILVPMVTSMLFLEQTLTAQQVVAVVIMLGAFVLLNIEGADMVGTKRGYWPLCALLFVTNGFYGAVNSLQANLVGDGEREEMIVIAYLGSAILAFACVAIKRRRAVLADFKLSAKAAACAICCAIAATVAVNLVMYLFARVNTTVLSTVDNGGVLITTTICAIALFGERPTKLQYAGLAAALGSIVLLSV